MTRIALLADRIPPGIIAAFVFGHVGRLRVVRRMRRVGGKIHQEGFVRRCSLVRLEHRNGLVGKIIGREIVVAIVFDRYQFIAFNDLARRVVIRFGAEEAIEAVEPALQRPRRFIRCSRDIVIGRIVPLAHGIGRIARIAQQLGERGRVFGNLTRLKTGIAGIGMGQPADAHGMRVLAGHYRRTGGGAHWHRGIVVKA